MENKNSISRILLSAILCACCIINAPQANAYDSLIQAIGDTVSPRTYELTSNETTSAALGTMGGADDAVFTVDGGANNYGIINTTSNKDARLYISKQAQTFNLQNVGSYTTTTSDSIIAGKSVITDVVVGNEVKDFGIIDPASANNSSYTGFLRSAGKSNVTNSVFYNIKGLYGAAIQNRENGTLSVKNSVIVGNTSMQGAIHNDSTQKIADISDSVFYNNTAIFVTGSGNKNIASAIHNKSGKTIDLITGSTFTNNTATGDSSNLAATIYNAGTIGTISDSIFYNNTSINSGAVIYNDITGTITTLSGSYFVNNNAVGGILETKSSISNLSNLTFTGNTVEKNGIISLHNDTAASSISIGEINNVQVTGNTGSGIYIRTGKSDSTLNIGKITGGTKFNNNTEDGLYMGGNSGIINVTEISNSEFSNNTKTGFYIQNINSGSGQITISKITDNTKINGNLEGGILLQRNGSNTLGIGEISDTEIKNNTITTLTKRGAGLRNEGAHITKMSGVVFENDNLDYTTNGTLGGAIYNSAYGQIDEMTDITISYCSAYNGGAMYNLGTIGSIDGMMVSNIDTSDVMIATEENAHIETINDMTIQNSAGTGLSFFGGTGGTIQNSTFTNMYGAGAKMGYGLQVTANATKYDGHVNLIDNIIVAGNQTGGMRIDDNGSSSHTANVGLIKNSQFTNNGTSGNPKAGGIWAKTDVLTISADGAGKTTTFKGNKRQNNAVGIWMENKNSTLNLQQLNGGEMFMYDPINGTSNRYYVNISGDNSGTLHLYDDIVNGMVDVQDTNISTVDGTIHNYTFSTLSSDTDSKYILDIHFDVATTDPHSTIDTFTLSHVSLNPESLVTRSTSGKMTLKALNFINDDADFPNMIGKSATMQVIKAPGGSTLELVNGFEEAPGGFLLFTLQDDVKTEYDPVGLNTSWLPDQIKVYDVTTKVLGNVDILTTDTTKDTLKITIAQSTQQKEWNGSYLDTLKAVNQADLATRNFVTDVSSAVYNVTDNLGITAAGNFNIKGKDSELSLINFNETEHYKGFELNNTTNLTLENVEIKNSSQLVSGMATDVNMNIYNSYLHDNGKGIYSAGNANIEGTTQINDDFYLMGDTSELTVTGQIRGVATPADITFNKKLAGSGTSTFTFSSGTLTLGSSASVDDTNLVLNNSVLNVGANNAFSNVNLTAAGADLNLKNESTGEQTFDTLTLNNDINIDIDVDLQNGTTDKIIVSNTGDEAVAANGHNIIIDSIYILTDGEDTTTNVELTDDDRLKGVYKLSDSILDNITQASTVSGYYSVSYKDFDSSVDPNKGILVFTNNILDTLASTIVKNVGDDAIKAYILPSEGETAETNLETLIGAKLTINGNGGEADTNFIEGGDIYTGFTIGDGKTQTLEVNDVAEWSGFTDSAIINKSQGTVKINNVNFSGNGISDIDNSGKLEFTGTNSLEKVNDSAANGTTEITGGTTTVGSLTQKTLKVDSDGTLTNNGNSSVTNGGSNAGTINGSGKLSTGGTFSNTGSISNDISNSGTFTNAGSGITGDVETTAGTFNNNAKITGSVNVTGGTFTNDGGIDGNVTSASTFTNNAKIDGTLTTTGGTFTNEAQITGAVNNGGILNSDISKLESTVNNTGTFNMSGDLSKDITGNGTTVLQSTTANVAENREIQGTLDVNSKTLGMNNNIYETLTVGKLNNNGNLTLDVNAQTNLSDEIHVNNAGSNSVLTITTLNLTKPTVTGDSGEYTKQILTGTTTGATLALSQDLQKPVITGISRTGSDELKTNTINWNDNYGGWKQAGTQSETLSIVNSSGTLQDSIKYSINKVWDAKEFIDKVENLALINQYAGTDPNNRSMNFSGIFEDTTAKGTYTVQANLGTSTAGTFTLNGVKDGDKNTTVDLNNHSGFVLDNATTLDIKNIDMKGKNTLITVNNENASITLNNTNMQGAITGSKEYNMTTTGDNALQDVINANVTNSGNLSLSGTNDLVNITGTDGATKITGGTTTVGNVNQKSVTIDSAATKLVVTNGIATSDGVTNNKTNGLEVQGGVISSDISGTGKTVINGTDVSVKYGNKIEQDIVINENKKLVNTSVTAIKGRVENNGDIQLYSQDNSNLTENITGNGTTEFNQKVTVSADVENAINIKTFGNYNADITVESGNNFGLDGKNITIDAANKLTMQDIADAKGNLINNGELVIQSGTLAKSISGIGTTKIDGSLTLDDASSIEGTLDINRGNVTVSPDAITEHSVGALKGDGNFALDIDYSASPILSDTITITNDSRDSATVKITSLTEIGTRPADFEKQILFGANSNTQLDISAIKSQFDMAADEVQKSVAKDLTAPKINWNDDYGTENWTETYKRELSVIGSTAGLLDTIKYESTMIDESAHIFNPKADNLAIINKYDGSGKENREFNFDSAENEFKVTENTGVTESGNLAINGVADGETRSTIDYDSHSGFELNNDNTTVTLKNVEVKNASSLVSGNAGTGVKVVLDNVNIHDNGSGIQTAGDVEIKGNSTIGDDINVTGDNSQINIDGTDVVNLDKNLTGNGTSKLNIENGTVNIGENAKVSALDTTFNNTTLNVANENSLSGINTTFNGTTNLNISNNKVGTLAFDNVNLNGVLKMQVDADLANAQMDKLTATSASIGAKGRIEVSKINLLSPTTQKQLNLLFTSNKDLASVVNYTGEGQIAYSPIYKYNTSYVQKGDGKGYFSFVTPGNSYNDFNPSVMASSVTAIVTGYQNQMQSLHDGFYHMDRYMKYSDSYRLAAENQNKVASLAPVTDLDINKIPETSKAMWTLPYSTFERVNLKGGVKVDNIAYGMTYGGDSDMFDIGHGFKGVWSGFLGYNGNHMNYDGISMTQNGGFIGATLNAYKGNFFTGLTVSTGASTGDADTMYGHDNITLLTAGVANKTGYNFEFKDGKIILQPSLFLGYSWVNTFDYTNSAGARINQDALNAIQIAPGVKVIGNTKNGWQPYAGVDMVWNVFMGRNQVKANDVVLPQLSERAYVQYGVGVQKSWADKFTGFLQAMVRNGGRNGVVLSAGLRWIFGKNDNATKKATAKKKTVIKQLR